MDFVFDSDDDVDLAALELVVYGIPRQVYARADNFNRFNELSFFQRFRLTKNTILALLPQIEHHLEFPHDNNQSVSPINQLLLCLRYYATGSHLLAMGDFAGVHVSTACRIIKKVSHAIALMYPNYIKMPQTADEIHRAQEGFFQISAFPRVIGALDCTHVRIQSPGGEDAEIYRNRKGYFSVNVQAVCNAQLKFFNVVARWPGSSHDSTIFNNSHLRAEFEQNIYPNCAILGDSGYYLRTYLMTPLLEPRTERQQLYNQSHIRTRNVIERTFGVWKRRFPVLAYGCRLKIETLLSVIISTAILHNIAIDNNEGEPPVDANGDIQLLQQLIRNGQIPVPAIPLHLRNRGAAADGARMRDELINNYFGNL
ncbi:hypothetical protein RI129_000373 [Pyrocoelia pectoralis]|uniref:DDE Tnp4 domain-containing protein n=1 Tax=Pyrocoelia pectoralis TaxID=417401 RepID=A0AAN7VRE6_9COLE